MASNFGSGYHAAVLSKNPEKKISPSISAIIATQQYISTDRGFSPVTHPARHHGGPFVFLPDTDSPYFCSMATEFIQSPLLSKPYVLTSEARSIVASTDQPKLTVSLSCNGNVFFSVDLCAFNGKVELLDPGKIVEDYFIPRDYICKTIKVKFGDAQTNLLFLFCDNQMPPDFDPESCLLISSNSRRVHHDSLFTIAALNRDPSRAFVIKAVGHDSSGQISSVQFFMSQSLPDVFFINVDVRLIVLKATGRVSVPDNPIVNPLLDVIYFSVENDGRQLMCYITPSPAFITFKFRNIFNVPELVDVEGAIVAKTVVSRQSAVCSGDILQYDRRVDKSYQLTSGPIPICELASLEQLVASRSAQIEIDDDFYDIVIDDHSFECSSEDDSLNTVKFTWRFKGQRPVNFNHSLFGILPSHRNIFSDQYSSEYE